MKSKYLFLPLILLLAAAALVLPQLNQTSSPSDINDVLGAPTSQSSKIVVSHKSQDYQIHWFEVANSDNITLSSNLTDLTPASELKKSNQCSHLINAGFYTKTKQSIGLFISEGKELRRQIPNSTFNGFYTINSFATPRITSALPDDELRLALQSGPILIQNSFPQDLSLKSDKPARRSVAATTGANNSVFLIVYKPESQFDGPLLADLPSILDQFQRAIGLNLADALNLDGGTASAFYTPEASISELSPIGSYFCIK